MAEDRSEERTERASERRLSHAREKGQIPRSKEFSNFFILFCCALIFYMSAEVITKDLVSIIKHYFTFDYEILNNPMPDNFLLSPQVKDFYFYFFIVLFLVVVVAILAHSLIGGFIISKTNFSFQAERINFFSGLKRMFSMQMLYELIKSFIKFLLISIVTVLFIKKYYFEILSLQSDNFYHSVVAGNDYIVLSFVMVVASLAIITAIDVPYQLWQYMEKLKMSRQELKEEHKELEGKPEIKSKIRELQRQYAKQRMMDKIPKADVVLTNPTHYAVALKYDSKNATAPIVVARGIDFVATQIQKVALANNVTIVSSPPLARAVYYSTKLDCEIPRGLFVAVAQVLAYVYQLRKFYHIGGDKPVLANELPIPDELRR